MPPAWERIAEAGPLTAFFGTVIDVIRAPIRFFESLSPSGPAASVIGFWMLTTLPPMVISGISAHAFLREMLEILVTTPEPVFITIPWWVFVIVAPLLQFASLLADICAVHTLLKMMGHARGGWSGTFRAAGYASAPAIFGYIPYVGALVGGLWMGVLQFVALKRIHQVPTWILLLAYLLPVVVILILATATVVIVISLIAPDLLGLPVIP